MGFDIDPTWLLLSFIPSGIGFVLFSYGRKQRRSPQIVAGLLFMVYPYVAPNAALLAGGGALIGLGLWGALKGGL